MATLEDLNYKSLTDMSHDEALELIRQIRLSRRVPVKKISKTTKEKLKPLPKVDADQAAELLRILGGN